MIKLLNPKSIGLGDIQINEKEVLHSIFWFC